MYDRVLATYCPINDPLKVMQHSEDSRAEFSDMEVIPTAIVEDSLCGPAASMCQDD